MKVIILLMLHDVIGTGRVPDVGKWAIRHDFPFHRIDSIIEVWLESPVPVLSTQAKGKVGDLRAILDQVMDVTEISWRQSLDIPSRLRFLEFWRFGPMSFGARCQYESVLGWHVLAAKVIEVPKDQHMV